MFTGLVADLGTVEEIESTADGARLTVATALAPELGEGDSVAVNGICLTATAVTERSFRADAMHETLRRTALADLSEGHSVNLELAVRANDRLGGHIVQGHVDGVGEVLDVSEEGFARLVRIGAGPEILRYLVEKGSVAVSGVSLTVAALDDHSFTVSLIPETLSRTTLGSAREGSPVNLEVDLLAKYVERLVSPR